MSVRSVIFAYREKPDCSHTFKRGNIVYVPQINTNQAFAIAGWASLSHVILWF